MLFGFILASILVEVIGGFWTWAFSSAVASAQGNSWTGLFSIIGFFAVYVLTCLSIVNTCFAAIHVVPDNALGWLGGQMSNSFGRGTEDYVNSKTGGAITAIGSQGRPGGGAKNIKEERMNQRRFGGGDKGGNQGDPDITGSASAGRT